MNPLEDDEDPWPDEPDEFDPDSLGPETPDVEPEVASSFEAAADVDEDIFRAFWGAVVFLNVGVAALSVGAMLVYFRGDWATGGPAMAIGLVAVAFVGRFYLTYLSARENEDTDGAGDVTSTADDAPGDGTGAAERERPPEPAYRDGRTGSDR